jgi:hypothetical protein
MANVSNTGGLSGSSLNEATLDLRVGVGIDQT